MSKQQNPRRRKPPMVSLEYLSYTDCRRVIENGDDRGFIVVCVPRMFWEAKPPLWVAS